MIGYYAKGRMLSVGRLLIIILVGAVIVHILLGAGLSLFTDYRIWRPVIENSRQEIILVRDVNSNEDRTYTVTNQPVPVQNGTVRAAYTQNAVIQLLMINRSEATKGFESTEQQLFDNETSLSSTVLSKMHMIPQDVTLKMCPETPPYLIGPIKVWFDKPTFEETERLYPYLEPGGHGKPKSCVARHRVAIVVPYRDRESHLRILLHNLHSLLTKQQLDYAIFVVEQLSNETFNRGKLMNVGFVEAMKLYDWQCFIFHDVDLLPENDRNIYSCPEHPRHMSVAIDKFQYKLPYGSIFGGISAIRTSQFVEVNGFSNNYWGWGGEDDDLSMRVTNAGHKIMRYPTEIARYKMIKHKNEAKNPVNPCRYNLLGKAKQRQQRDGISSLKYETYDLQLRPLFTHIKVKLLEQESTMLLRKEGINC